MADEMTDEEKRKFLLHGSYCPICQTHMKLHAIDPIGMSSAGRAAERYDSDNWEHLKEHGFVHGDKPIRSVLMVDSMPPKKAPKND